MVANIRKSIAERELKTLAQKMNLSKTELHLINFENSIGSGNVVSLEIRSEACTEIITEFGKKGLKSEIVATRVACNTQKYLDASVVVGRYLADPLLIPMAMSGGDKFSTLPPTKHTTTNINIIKKNFLI